MQNWWAFTSRRSKSKKGRPVQTLYVSADGLPTPADASHFFTRYFQRLGLTTTGKVSRTGALPINATRLVIHDNQQIYGERLKLLGSYPPPSKPGDWA